jgi:hypothetical protein
MASGSTATMRVPRWQLCGVIFVLIDGGQGQLGAAKLVCRIAAVPLVAGLLWGSDRARRTALASST